MNECPKCQAPLKVEYFFKDKEFQCGTRVSAADKITYQSLECRLGVAERQIALMQEHLDKLVSQGD